MLGLFEKKADHPMTDIKSAQKLLDEIPKDDPLKALLELTAWLESVAAEPDFRADYQFQLLRLLYETAHPHERKLTRECFAVQAPPKPLENRLWMALSEYYLQISQACINVLRRYRKGDDGAAALHPELPVVTARGIGAVAGRLKYAAVRYAPVEQSAWVQLAEFYSTAGLLHYLDLPVTMYSAPNADTSVRREFATVLVWYASCAGSVSRLDLHLAQRLAVHLRACFTVDTRCSVNSMIDFDLQHPVPPTRISTPRPQQEGLLFIGVENVHESIAVCIESLEGNFVPEDINLGGYYDAHLVRAVLHRLDVCWSRPQQARRNARHKVKVQIRVVQGFHRLLEKIRPAGDAAGDSSIVWETDDISGGGFHSILTPQNAEGLEIGSIIGYQPENVGHWGVGIVRRLNRDRFNNLQVGIELLSSSIHYVSLREHNVEAARELPGLLLMDQEYPQEVGLMMQPQTFFSGLSLQVRMGDRNFLLIPLATLAIGKHYDFGRYRKFEQEED